MANGNGSLSVSGRVIQWMSTLALVGSIVFGAYKWCNGLSYELGMMSQYAERISEDQKKTADLLEDMDRAIARVLEENRERRGEHKEMLGELRRLNGNGYRNAVPLGPEPPPKGPKWRSEE